MSPPLYRIEQLPAVSATDTGDKQENTLVSRMRGFRLESLQTSPDSFASSYDEEVSWPVEKTRERVSTPQITHYVAVPQQIATGELPLSGVEWLGFLAAIGPEIETPTKRAELVLNPWAKTKEGEGLNTDGLLANKAALGKCLHYHYNALFVRPSARGNGLGEALFRTAMDDARRLASANGVVDVRYTLALDSANIAALRLYQKLGFGIVLRRMYKPRPRGGMDQAERETTVMEYLLPLNGM